MMELYNMFCKYPKYFEDILDIGEYVFLFGILGNDPILYDDFTTRIKNSNWFKFLLFKFEIHLYHEGKC